MKLPIEVLLSTYEGCVFGTDNLGICLACGELADGCEQDAEKYECDFCGKLQVYGLEQALLMGYITLVDERDETEGSEHEAD